MHTEKNNNAKNFNSRPHEEVDKPILQHDRRNGISTHDLTKRSTFEKMADELKVIISTHDLTKRSTYFRAVM